MPTKSAYITVYDALKRMITDGRYKPGDLLPPEPALCAMFNVSRTTVRKAAELLARDGFVGIRQGFGTAVLNYRTMQNLNVISSFTETLTKRGYEVTLQGVTITREPADRDAADALGITEGEDVAHVRRTTAVSGTPIALIDNYVPYNMVDGIEEYAGRFVSFYRFLEERYCIRMEMARDRISACEADPETARLLALPAGSALLNIRRLCVFRGRPVSLDKLRIRGDMYEFEVSMYGRG